MRKLSAVAVVASAVVAAFVPVAALAHEQRSVGPLTLVVGWDTEPAYAGFINAIGVDVERGGTPVTGAKLQAVVIFGDRNATTKSAAMAMEPGFEQPGHYSAPIVPSRPGMYTFHITGTAGGTRIDQFFTSGDDTFDDIKEPAAIAFPARDPSSSQLASRLDRTDKKLNDVGSAGSRSTIALAVGALGALIGIIALVRR